MAFASRASRVALLATAPVRVSLALPLRAPAAAVVRCLSSAAAKPATEGASAPRPKPASGGRAARSAARATEATPNFVAPPASTEGATEALKPTTPRAENELRVSPATQVGKLGGLIAYRVKDGSAVPFVTSVGSRNHFLLLRSLAAARSFMHSTGESKDLVVSVTDLNADVKNGLRADIVVVPAGELPTSDEGRTLVRLGNETSMAKTAGYVVAQLKEGKEVTLSGLGGRVASRMALTAKIVGQYLKEDGLKVFVAPRYDVQKPEDVAAADKEAASAEKGDGEGEEKVRRVLKLDFIRRK